jgi:putative hemin transport protein
LAADQVKEIEPQTTEAELITLSVGQTVTKLEGNRPDLLKRLPELGYVMSLTRNEACVLEHKANFEQIDIMDAGPHKMPTVIGKIETRVFFAAWKYEFAQTLQTEKGVQNSLQFFDASGEAITKVYMQGEKSNEKAYDAIVNDFKAASQTSVFGNHSKRSSSICNRRRHRGFPCRLDRDKRYT